jgi:hypothetical protein
MHAKTKKNYKAAPNDSDNGSASNLTHRVNQKIKIVVRMNFALVDHRLKSRDFKYSIDYCSELCNQIRDVLNSNRSFSAGSSSIPRSLSRKMKNKCTVSLSCFRCASRCKIHLFISFSIQVGIMLHGTKIEGTLIGGPSFGLIFKGDQIVRIDGKDVTSETVLGALRGCDIPGSTVTITIQRQSPVSEEPGLVIQNNRLKLHADDGNVDVEVTRMATADIADHQRIFELFTIFKVCFLYGVASH